MTTGSQIANYWICHWKCCQRGIGRRKQSSFLIEDGAQILKLALIIKASCKGLNDRINSSVPSTGHISITVGMWRLVHNKGNRNTLADSPHKASLWSKTASPSFMYKPSDFE